MSADAFRDRLRRLLREDAGAAAAPASAEIEVKSRPVERPVASVRERLARRRPSIGTLAESVERAASVEHGARVEGSVRPSSRGAPVRLDEMLVPEGQVLARTTRFDRAHRHGLFALREVEAIERDVVALVARDPALADVDFSRALYLDTETTGLSGGAGTYVFIVGLGRFDDDGFRLWQGFLEHPALERALLAEVARRIRASSAIVSFFGKSFDRHRLEDRMRLHGIDPPFAQIRHLDLFHPLQRLVRGALGDARLRTLESALCGVERHDDLSGALAPAAWFDFLAGRAHALEGVLDHNRDDVLSLVTLLAHLGRSIRELREVGQPLAGPSAARARGIARLFAQVGRHSDAAVWFERASVRVESEFGSCSAVRPLRLARAECLAKCGASGPALESLRVLCADPEDECSASAWLLYAGLCERTLHDAPAALAACQRAAQAIERWHTGTRYARMTRACRARRLRLERAIELSSSRPGGRA